MLLLITYYLIMLADLLFPEITETLEDLEKKYPKRQENQTVTRMAPSPTWFVHIWNVYSAMLDDIFAHKNPNWVCMLRIEDTDQKREVPWAKEKLSQTFKKFGIKFDEWTIWENGKDVWNYWPYTQSQREYIYKVFVKELVARWLAYPCFMCEDELCTIREEQTIWKQVPWIYMNYSKWRWACNEDIEESLKEKKEFVIRFKSPWKIWDRVVLNDLIKWKVETNDNFLDIVILKKWGLPTYHFAHLVDDYLMWTTHVIRSDEWFASQALHEQLFNAFWFKAPLYVHYSPLIKLDNGNKRKLSKRKDSEANVEYYFEKWYLVPAIIDYLANIINAWYEDWRKQNMGKDFREFDFKIENMSKAGALIDMDKLDSISKDFIANLDKEKLYNYLLEWSKDYDKDLFEIISKNPDYTKQILNIEREQEKPPKRFAKMSDISSQLLFFFDKEYEKLEIDFLQLSSNLKKEDISKFLKNYLENFSLEKSKDEWFLDLKEIASKSGFAQNNEEFKTWNYIGKVWDAAMILRIVLCWQTQTPDLYETMKVLWKDRVEKRIRKFL